MTSCYKKVCWQEITEKITENNANKDKQSKYTGGKYCNNKSS